jgi:hypothetical protein
MNKIITQYFAQNGQLVIPTFGIIKWLKQDAVWVNSILQSPKESIVFERSDAKPNKLFYHFLSEQLSVSFDQAIIQYDQFIDQLFSIEENPLALGQFGILSKKEDAYHWATNFNSNAYFKDIEINPNELQEEMGNRKRKFSIPWYVWALLLTLFAIVAILFKFL